MKVGKVIKKQVKKTRGKAIKRYFNKGYTPKVQQVINDVMLLKKMVNAEKKLIDVTPSSSNFALYGNAGATIDGAYTVDITPTPTQGTGRSNRNGNSIKLTSACLDIRIDQGATAESTYKYVGYIFCRKDAQVALTAGQIKDQLFEVNPFLGIRDLNSNRDPESGLAGYRVITRFTGSFPMDATTGASQFRHHKIPLKLNTHVRFNADGSTKVESNQMVLVIFASIGNTTTTNTLFARANCRWYFYDN